jgi:iron complex outermembrane receptor protein
LTRSRILLAVAGVLGSVASAARAQPFELPAVEVVAPTPIPGLGIPRDRLPANVQTLRGNALHDAQPASAAEASARLPSVSINEIQGNPFQPDLSFRGFTASPLLGTPQGLSVYQDGVRINAPFGDTVSWDLVPMSAVDSLTLVPGSNPLFGLNTLGGALALRTKSGDTHPGAEAALSAGSFGRRAGQVEFGRALEEGMHAYVAGTWLAEDGWRDYSPSEVRQLFAKIGRRSGLSDFSLGLTAADTDLVGNGLVPQSFRERRREAIFTRPDNTRQQLVMLALNGITSLGASAELGGTLYHRRTRTGTLNGDVNDDYASNLDPPGVNNRTATRQAGWGGAVEWMLAMEKHQLVIGAAHDSSRSDFEQTAQLGVFDATRAVVPTGAVELENRLDGRTATNSVFVTDTWSVRPDLHFTLSGRYNNTRVSLRDTGPSAPALDGEHRFTRFNPAAGAAYQPTRALTLYGGYGQGSRAPSPIELGCADPARPCTLPNALAADPPLDQVITRTVELGARGKGRGGLRWNAGLFDSVNNDDILFVGTGSSAGYFTNFGKTRRRGMELGLSGRNGRARWSAAYSLVRATFQSPACIMSENNSSAGASARCAGGDLIAVRPGDRIPGVPEHSVKLGMSMAAAERWRVGGELLAFSEQYVRGNENNEHQTGGKVSGYALINLRARYRMAGGWELFARLDNLFDRRYATAGALAENPFDGAGRFLADPDQWTRETFYAPGAPRAGWIGLRYRFNGKLSPGS